MAADFAGGVTSALAAYLRAQMPTLAQVLTEWPSANTPLVMPSLTLITANEANLTSVPPVLRARGAPDGVSQVNQYTVGEYELRIQIDVWARNKPERQRIVQELTNAMYRPVDPPGLHLTLADYFGVLCTYWPEGYRNVDSEEAAQRQEWRSTFDVSVMAEAVIERTDSLITTVTVQLETPDEITVQGE